MTRIVIEIRGGCLANVYSSTSEVQAVTVIDWDAAEGSEDGKPSIWEEPTFAHEAMDEETREALADNDL